MVRGTSADLSSMSAMPVPLFDWLCRTWAASRLRSTISVQDSVSIIELINAIRTVKPTASVRYTDQDIRTHYSFEVSADSLREAGWKPAWSLEGGYEQMLEHFTGLTPLLAIDDELEEF